MPKRKLNEAFEDNRDLIAEVVEAVIQKKKARLEEAEEVLFSHVSEKGRLTGFDLKNTQKQIREILKHVMDEEHDEAVTGRTQNNEEPILECLYYISFPLSVTFEQIKTISNLGGVVNVSVEEREGNRIAIKCVLSNDGSLKKSYAYKDFLAKRSSTKDGETIKEKLKILFEENLTLIKNNVTNEAMNSMLPDGTKISVLKRLVQGPISFAAMNRLVQNPVIVSLSLLPPMKTKGILVRFELFNEL